MVWTAIWPVSGDWRQKSTLLDDSFRMRSTYPTGLEPIAPLRN